MDDSVRCIFNIDDYDYIVIECGYTERLIEKNFNEFLEDYAFDNIEFIGNVNYKKTNVRWFEIDTYRDLKVIKKRGLKSL